MTMSLRRHDQHFMNNTVQEFLHKILHTSCPFSSLQIWKVLSHYVQNWQNTLLLNMATWRFDIIKNCHTNSVQDKCKN